MGSDKAIICAWQGWTIIDIVIFDISKTTEIQNAITALRVKHQIAKMNCVADEDGVGGGVIDNTGIRGFVNNSSAIEESTPEGMQKTNYYNLQSQCGYGLAKIINENKLHFKAEISEKHKDEVIEELEQLKSFDNGSDGKLRILPKAEIKQNIGRSPDWRDVLLMRYYFELKPKSKKVRAYL